MWFIKNISLDNFTGRGASIVAPLSHIRGEADTQLLHSLMHQEANNKTNYDKISEMYPDFPNEEMLRKYAGLYHDQAVTTSILQKAARRVFNLKSSNAYIDPWASHLEKSSGYNSRKYDPHVEKLIRDIKDNTDNYLRKHKIEWLHLYRGEGLDKDPRPNSVLFNEGHRLYIAHRKLPSLSSWTTDKGVARHYAILTSAVSGNHAAMSSVWAHRSRIAAIPQTGLGSWGDKEVVLIGGDTPTLMQYGGKIPLSVLRNYKMPEGHEKEIKYFV